ncbi:MAG: hypothetical protein WD278_04610, partial [Pirellulales bacterium]
MREGELLFRGQVILADRVLRQGTVQVRGGRIVAVHSNADAGAGPSAQSPVVDGGDGFISPGYVDLHVHGGDGADFMDGTQEAFRTVLA